MNQHQTSTNKDGNSDDEGYFYERTKSNLSKRGCCYFTSRISLLLYVFIPIFFLTSFSLYMIVAFESHLHRVDYLQESIGSKALGYLSGYFGKMVDLFAPTLNMTKQDAEVLKSSAVSKLESALVFDGLAHAFLAATVIMLVIYMRVVVISRMILGWVIRLVKGAKPAELLLLDFGK